MLQLSRAYTGEPGELLGVLPLQARTVFVYPSADTLIVRNAKSLELERILSLWEVFPSILDSSRTISDIVVDPGLKLLGAVSGTFAGFWYPSGKTEAVWRVHSSIQTEEDITAVDCKDGLLAVGTTKNLGIYNLSLQNDLPTWSRKSVRRVPWLRKLSFSPALTHLAAVPSLRNGVTIIPTATLKPTQSISHPREVTCVSWRHGKSSNAGDLVLCTITNDMVLRIFAPVLDSPTYLQLQASIAASSLIPPSQQNQTLTVSNIFLWDPWILASHIRGHDGDQNETRFQKVKKILNGGWDLFVVALIGKSLVVRGVVNIDSRPPALLRQFDILQIDVPKFEGSRHLILASTIQQDGNQEIFALASSPLRSLQLDLPLLFDDSQEGLSILAQALKDQASSAYHSKITDLVRTPDGRGLAIRRSDGGGIFSLQNESLILNHSWSGVHDVVVLDKGRAYVLYVESPSSLIAYDRMGTSAANLDVPPLKTFFAVPSEGRDPVILAVTEDFSLLQIATTDCRLSIKSISKLSLPDVQLVLPVDPMAWATYPQTVYREMLLCATSEGELSFWSPESETEWIMTGQVHTGRHRIRLARCSSAKKTVLVTPCSNGEELTIWDSKESEFTTGLEYQQIFGGQEARINDLDWTSTYAGHSVLAVGFPHEILLLCEQRMTYFDQEPPWRVCHRIETSSLSLHTISDSIWLAHGSLLVGIGHHMLLYNEPSSYSSSQGKTNDSLGLFDYVNKYNKNLPDYHPQMLLQCLLWNKIPVVKEIIVRLAAAIEKLSQCPDDPISPQPLDVEDFLEPMEQSAGVPFSPISSLKRLSIDSESDEHRRQSFENLLQRLKDGVSLDLTSNEYSHLQIIIQSILEAEEQRRALDGNGLRYLISLKSFLLLNQRSNGHLTADRPFPEIAARDRMRYRDFVWAFHSESQEILLQTAISSVGGKLLWSDAKALGIFLWLKSQESLRTQMEEIARNQYLACEHRDPTSCSLLYFALGKHRLVHGLWKRATWHHEQTIMLKFLANDFNESRWKTAALKNAYALLGKQRPEYAAAFFLLGGSLLDAVNVCIRQLKDFQLAIAIARVVEKADDGPIFIDILQNTVVPTAFREGNRWLGSWAFWCLKKRDLALRILISPLNTFASDLGLAIESIAESRYDDTSLALLYSQLKSMSLQTLKGASEIPGQTEFNFVKQIARVFCRMGCHVLALDLVKNWTFTTPEEMLVGQHPVRMNGRPPKLAQVVHPQLPHLPRHRRRPSILIDMDLYSEPPSRTDDPSQMRIPSPIPENGVISPPLSPTIQRQKSDFGSLLKSAKKVSRMAEFDISSFGDFALPPTSQSEQEAINLSNSPPPQEDRSLNRSKPFGFGSFIAPKKTVDVPEFDMSSFF